MTEYQKHGGWRPGGGRPKLPEGQARTVQSKVMWKPDELARLDRAVAYLNTRRADLIRQAVLEFVESLEASHKIERSVD